MAWYDFGPVLSLNGAWNFVPGGRSIGKTYGAKKLVIKKAIGKDEQFVYVRRYRDGLMTSARSFFADIEHEFPDFDFRVNGRRAEMATVASRDDKKREWVTIGHFIALSIAQQIKSTAFPKVSTIIFDEFIEETAVPGYLADEFSVFQNLYVTIARNRDVRVLFLANAVSMMNPYFIELGMEPDRMPKMGTMRDGFIAYEFPDHEKYGQEMRNTRFGRFIKGTEYEKYAIVNTFADANDALVKRKSPYAKPMYNLETDNGVFSVWRNPVDDEFYISSRAIKGASMYTLEPKRMNKGKKLILNNSPLLAELRYYFRDARVVFSSAAARNTFAQIFKR